MSASVEQIKLPFRTNATDIGPLIEYQRCSLLVKYDHVDFNGAIKWVSVTFAEVLAYEVYEGICCPADTVIDSDVIEVRKESSWLSQIVGEWKVAVGWQQYQQDLGGEKRFKHYVIFFDDVCAVQVIASACSTKMSRDYPTVAAFSLHLLRGPNREKGAKMGLGIVLETENGQQLHRVDDTKNILHRLLPSRDDESYQLLRFIDWYGDTTFNHLQIPTLLRELDRISNQKAQTDEERALLREIVFLARKSQQTAHLYVKFYGD